MLVYFHNSCWENRGPILSLWLGDIADTGIGLPYPPASLCRMAGRYDNPMQIRLYPASQGLSTWLQSGMNTAVEYRARLLNVYGAPELIPRNEFRQPM